MPIRAALIAFALVFAVSISVIASVRTTPQNQNQFVGSETCETCHQATYERWKKTLMANVLVDAKERPDWVLGDFSRPNPLVTFRKEDIAFTYGSKWKQRYYTKVGDDYFVFPAQWDVAARMWRRY